MLAAIGATKHQNGEGLAVHSQVLAGAEDWIPAYAGMTVWEGATTAIFVAIAHVGCHRHHET